MIGLTDVSAADRAWGAWQIAVVAASLPCSSAGRVDACADNSTGRVRAGDIDNRDVVLAVI